MKKTLLVIMLVLFVTMAAAAEEKTSAGGGVYDLGWPFDGDISMGYRWVNQDGSSRSGEYDNLHSSGAGAARIEWDPLPNRFNLETEAQGAKDYFGEVDYAYRDVIMMNVLSRKFTHNLEHFALGTDDPATAVPSFTDLNPGDKYFTDNSIDRAQIRIKTPDFPFHVYLEARQVEKEGTVQQFFMPVYAGGFSKASESRDISWKTQEAKATTNAHLGPLEVEYSHFAKKFTPDSNDTLMTETVPGSSATYEHNFTPELQSSSDTVKVHTSHTGRIAAAATYSVGEKENKDSEAKATFMNAAGDLTLVPWKELTISFKYRHYDIDEDTPDAVTTSTLSGTPATYAVRNGISSQRDLVSGTVRFRVTQNLTVRAEYDWENLFRDVGPGYDTLSAPADAPAYWTLDERVSKSTTKLGATYRLTNRLMLRGDVSRETAAVPENSVDVTYPDLTEAARGSLTWSPAAWFNLLLSGGTVHEERTDLPAPFAGTRTTDRNRALGSFTVLVGRRFSITPSYSFIQNKTDGVIAYQDDTGGITAETGVPYADVAHVGAVSLGYVMSDEATLTVDASRSWLRGDFRVSGAVPGSDGIAQLSDLKVIESAAGADLQVHYTRYLGTDFRYQIRKYNDLLDSTQDGTSQIALATLTFKW